MSIIFGIRKAEGQTVEEPQLLLFAHATDRYAPDGTFVRVSGQIGMGFQPYHTHERSFLESQPAVDERGNMLILDGRLDNHTELSNLLDIEDNRTADSRIMLAGFARWGESCFSRFIGDWALVLWSSVDRRIYLVADHAGTRTLYFKSANGELQWSTYLETFLAGARQYPLNKAYATAFLDCRPIRDLTPYEGIWRVPPAHCIIVHNDDIVRKPHWTAATYGKIRYGSDVEYEQQFLLLFEQSIERRVGCGDPVLAQLSGGMDSTSIVCMSDYVGRSQDPPLPQVDTISYYDDSEPHWNERPFFSLVETFRGKSGTHVETSFSERTFEPLDPSLGIYLLPGADSSEPDREATLETRLAGRGYRVILSGIGGDELLGGVPTPTPELADCLMSGDVKRLLTRATSWCLANRIPLLKLLSDTFLFACGSYCHSTAKTGFRPPWVKDHSADSGSDLHEKNVPKIPRLGLSPSAINNAVVWASMMETLPHLWVPSRQRREYRYPFLDRNLVEFLLRVPREQLLRPNRRRSLMRRALTDIVPREILERPRKAYLDRGPLQAMRDSAPKIRALFDDPLSAAYDIVDPVALERGFEDVVAGRNLKSWSAVMRAVTFELWLRGTSRVLTKDTPLHQRATGIRAGLRS